MKRLSLLVAVVALMAMPTAVFAHEEFNAELSTGDEVPAPTVPSDYAGTGDAVVIISDDATSIDFEVNFEGLTGPAVMAHIHWGETGAAGPPIFWLTPQGTDDNPSPLTGTLTEADFVPADGGPQTFEEALDAMRAGDTYVNVHTEANMSGEIRGQLAALPDTATPDEGTSSALRTELLLVLLLGAATFVLAARRFPLRQTR